jgi:outer membrane protein assembly factor BamB
VEPKTGETVWRGRVEGTYSASPVAVGGRIYAFNEDGKTTVIDAGRELKVLGESQLDEGFMASPAIDGKAFYLRTVTHLYRIEEGG